MERIERCDGCQFRVDLEKSPEIRPRVAPAETVGAERRQPAGHPRRNLIGNHLHIIGNRDKHAFFVLQD